MKVKLKSIEPAKVFVGNGVEIYPDKIVITYKDRSHLPEHLVGEIIHGALYTHPRPAPKHARACSVLGGRIGELFDWGTGPGGWQILDEPELHLGPDVLVPDLAGWRRERMPKLPETWFELAPDWVCEILSSSTARLDRALKLPLYARYGIGHLWLVDPELQTLEVYVLDTAHEQTGWLLLTVLEGGASVRQPPFDAVEFSLGGLWG